MKKDPSSGKIVRMSRRASFSAAHLYSSKSLSTDDNRKTFGKCFSEHGHGHDYLLEAFFEGRIDEKTGLIINLLDIDELLKDLTERLDHKHLNFDLTEFKDKVPTTEVLAQFCFDEIEKLRVSRMNKIEMRLYKIRLFENEDIWVECRGAR